jgi:glycerophosphoryl diester phosphodiesterase
MRPGAAALAFVLTSACAADTALDAGRDAPRNDAPRDAGRPIDPARFDCSGPADPVRVSPVPFGCPVDAACVMRMMSAHRGAGAPGVLAPENSLAATRAAIVLGADLVEMDVRFTADGVAVLMHDADVDRTTDGTGPVEGYTLDALSALALDAGELPGDFSCERVPTLADELALTAGRIVAVLDLSKTDRLEEIVDEVLAAGALDRVVFDHPDLAALDRVIAHAPEAHVLLRATDPDALGAGLDHLAAHPPVYVHVEDADPAALLPSARGQRLFALGFTRDLLAPRDLTAYESAYAAGATMLQTNRPDLLGAFLGR